MTQTIAQLLFHILMHVASTCHSRRVRPSIHISIHPFIHPSHQSIHPSIHSSIHPSTVSWVHRPKVSNAHFTIISASLCLVPSFSEYIFPRYTIPLHRQASLFLVCLPFVSLPSPRTPPPLPVCYLPIFRFDQ